MPHVTEEVDGVSIVRWGPMERLLFSVFGVIIAAGIIAQIGVNISVSTLKAELATRVEMANKEHADLRESIKETNAAVARLADLIHSHAENTAVHKVPEARR